MLRLLTTYQRFFTNVIKEISSLVLLRSLIIYQRYFTNVTKEIRLLVLLRLLITYQIFFTNVTKEISLLVLLITYQRFFTNITKEIRLSVLLRLLITYKRHSHDTITYIKVMKSWEGRCSQNNLVYNASRFMERLKKVLVFVMFSFHVCYFNFTL